MIDLRSTCAALAFASMTLACINTPAQVVEEQKAEEAKTAEEAKAKAEAEEKAKTELTAEELELLDADPKTLTPEQRRKRAYALRKRIMQNPDSPTSQALEDIRRSALAGELDEQIPGQEKKDEGMIIPAPAYLRSDEQAVSHDEPAQPEDKPAE